MTTEKKDALKLWGGRFESGPSEVFERFSFSLHFDRKLFQADVLGSQAYARALAGVGIRAEIMLQVVRQIGRVSGRDGRR